MASRTRSTDKLGGAGETGRIAKAALSAILIHAICTSLAGSGASIVKADVTAIEDIAAYLTSGIGIVHSQSILALTGNTFQDEGVYTSGANSIA